MTMIRFRFVLLLAAGYFLVALITNVCSLQLRPVFLRHNVLEKNGRYSKARRTTMHAADASGGGGGCGCGGKDRGSDKNVKASASSSSSTQSLPLSSNLPNYSAGYFPEPSFRVLQTGEGTLSVSIADTTSDKEINGEPRYACQFAQFSPRESFAGRVAFAMPPEANAPLSPLGEGGREAQRQGDEEDEAAPIAVVTRGLCSFEAKMRAAVAAGAEGVILVNRDADETFLAVADDRGDQPPSTPGKPSPPQSSREIPFVVVPSSVEAVLKNGVHVSVEPHHNENVSTCWGSWSANSNSRVDDDNREGSGNGARMVLPLFPVTTGPLLPGAELQMKLGKRERNELLHASSNAPGGSPLVSVAVAFCTDPATNAMATVACVALADLSDKGQVTQKNSVTLRGVEPCVLRTLLRDSTATSFGLVLASTAADRHRETEQDTVVAAAVRERMHALSLSACNRASADGFCDLDKTEVIAEKINSLPRDATDFSFAACRSLGLPPQQLQAALACTTEARLSGVSRALRRLEERDDPRDTEVEGDGKDGDERRPRSFVAGAVARALSAVVRVELSLGEKAAGFVVGRDGLIATNRHVVAAGGVPLVTFQDGVALPARTVAVSESHDIAFLAVERGSSPDLPVAPLGNSDAVQLGDWVITVGSPAEFDNLVSLGIASTIQRPTTKPGADAGGSGSSPLVLDCNAAFIGTDALFNKGISGGPLLNHFGEVVGMCTYLREDLNGLGFAIAINRVKDAAHELLGRNL